MASREVSGIGQPAQQGGEPATVQFRKLAEFARWEKRPGEPDDRANRFHPLSLLRRPARHFRDLAQQHKRGSGPLLCAFEELLRARCDRWLRFLGSPAEMAVDDFRAVIEQAAEGIRRILRELAQWICAPADGAEKLRPLRAVVESHTEREIQPDHREVRAEGLAQAFLKRRIPRAIPVGKQVHHAAGEGENPLAALLHPVDEIRHELRGGRGLRDCLRSFHDASFCPDDLCRTPRHAGDGSGRAHPRAPFCAVA